MSSIVAIVGRPNVGKSALFNRIARRRIAIVHDQPGVTRDRISVEAEWNGRPFTLVDTGGIGLSRGEKARDIITRAAIEQVELAIEAADVIILVVNVQEGAVPLDREVADRLRESRKPILVAANKADHYQLEQQAVEFTELGFERVFPLSAIHGQGVDDLMEAVLGLLPEKAETPAGTEPALADEQEKLTTEPLKLAIVGRPNVGKSSIINALTRSERVIVTPIAGTTRDAVDVPFEVETEGVRQPYILIDTAGVRQERRIDDSVEFYSVKRTEDSIARSDIVVYVFDAQAGVTAQDKKVAGKVVEENKACILVINKWDLFQETVDDAKKDQRVERAVKKPRHGSAPPVTLAAFGEWVQKQLFFLDYAPVIFTSAKSGFHLERLLEAIRYVAAQLKQRISTSLLNRTLNDAVERRQPVSSAGHRLKFFYATQVKQAPPIFLLFVNRVDLFSDAYKKYLAGEMRKSFGYEGCPIVLVPRARPKTIEPKRKFKTGPRQTEKGVRRARGEKHG
jgi:GTPase